MLDLSPNGSVGHARLGFETERTIDRKDFGLLRNAALETGGLLASATR
jgi:polyisoprenoid-binding protein YceI